ncbi:MAG: SufS family cysteine desulfurase [Patescibacteria group bacterium]
MFNVNIIRNQFPFFKQKKNNKNWAFLDNAASSQKPEIVLRAMDEFYRTTYANIHRGIYDIAEVATTKFEQARDMVAKFINAPSSDNIIFTKNATEAINLVAYTLGTTFKPNEEILLSEMEHHANLIPWQQVARRMGAKLRFIPVTQDYRLDLAKLDELLNNKTRLVSIVAMSNTLGTINDIKYIIDKARKLGALVLVDGAQAVVHNPINVQQLDCDFLVFSSHKIYGPSGIGALYGKKEILESLPPFLTGGHMIADVGWNNATWSEVPGKFEAGTPPITEAIGFAEAIRFIQEIGWTAIENYEQELTNYALEQLKMINGLQLFGPADNHDRGALFSFTLNKFHAHDIAGVLNELGIAVRAGHHCTAPLHKKFGLIATTRASCAIYNTKEDIDRLVDGIKQVQKILT